MGASSPRWLRWVIGITLASIAAAPVSTIHGHGAGGSEPLAILLLSNAPSIDAQYARELSEAGISIVGHNYYEALTERFIRRFDVVVIDKLPHANEENHVFGQRMVPFHQNMEHVWRFAEAGGGVLVYTNLNDCGGALRGGWNREMKRWGVEMLQMCVRDPATAFLTFRVYGDNYYCWTENLAKHPVTEGLRRIYYPSVNGRWDDCYSAPPLVCDANWTPLVRGGATAKVITEVDRQEIDMPEHSGDTTLAAVRAAGKGRLAVLSINPAYTHQLGYSQSGKNSECNWGVLDGIILKKGDGQTASDTGTFLRRVYAWLAANSKPSGLGGYKTGEPVEKATVPVSPEVAEFQPQFDFDHLKMPPSWRHRPELVKVDGNYYVVEISDPLIQGELRYFKALVGIHSAASDGAGSVAEYVEAAKKAGYSMIVFAESFEHLTPDKWSKLLADCQAKTAEDFYCMPGIDIQDPAGNHFLLAGIDSLPRSSWLTPDGKRLAMTANINLLMHSHTVIAHRPLAGPLPYERLKHFQGLSVFTYRDGKLVEDATKAYDWHVMNGSSPHPIVVHEVFRPQDVARAAETGYQQIMPSDTIANAAGYFRAGIGVYYDAPSRHILSEGPTVDDFTVNLKDVGPAEMNREQFRVSIGVRSEVPLASVVLYDGSAVARRWLPQGKEFRAMADFRHTHQHGLYLVVEDAQGKRAITSSIRNIARRYHTRCTDRQNWLGDVGFCYTGTFLPPRMGTTEIRMLVKGTAEGQGMFPDVPGANMAVKLNFPFSCNDLVLTEAVIDEKYTRAMFDTPPWRVGFDATPSQASEPSTVYEAKLRYYNFTSTNRPCVSLVELEVKLRRDVEPVDPEAPFPAFGGLAFGKKYAWMKDGALVSGEIGSDDTIDIPPGGLAGGYIALSEGLQIRNGVFGITSPPGSPAVRKAGTRYVARYLIPTAANWQDNTAYTFDDAPDAWLKEMGLAEPTPYKLSFSRGRHERTTYFADVTAQRWGASGSVERTANLRFRVPLWIKGVNPRWSAGIWQENGGVTYTGVFESTAWPQLDVSRAGRFYAGNLLTADREELVLQLIRWSPDAIKVEVHNPTDAAIEATVSTPDEVTGLKRLDKPVSVPAGSTIYVVE